MKGTRRYIFAHRSIAPSSTSARERRPLSAGAGSGVSIVSATLADPSVIAWIDPSNLVPWLQVATLSVGFITGLGSAGLVFLKYLQRWRGRTSRD